MFRELLVGFFAVTGAVALFSGEVVGAGLAWVFAAILAAAW